MRDKERLELLERCRDLPLDLSEIDEDDQRTIQQVIIEFEDLCEDPTIEARCTAMGFGLGLLAAAIISVVITLTHI